MFGAYIDIYHDEISAAISSGDNARLCVIARAFCERCDYFRPWKITNVRMEVRPLDGLQVIVGVEFDGGSEAVVQVGHRNGKRRITLNGEDISCDSSADVVHALEVPCAFFDGIYFAAECLGEQARETLMRQIEDKDREIQSRKASADREWYMIAAAAAGLNKVEYAAARAEERLSRAVERRRLVGEKRTWTLCPADFSSRLIDASAMVGLCSPELIPLSSAKAILSGKSGIYFGWRVTDGKCVYVGKSKNLGKRVHPRRKELYDCQITYIEMPASEIHTWELFFIWLHKPERNFEVVQSSPGIMADEESEEVVVDDVG
jgi:hypothetical protein